MFICQIDISHKYYCDSFDCYVLNDITFNIYAILFNRRNAHEK